MKQPKFKFGDKVFPTQGVPFIISDIRRDAECDYIYAADRSGAHYAEFDLELYQEPQKKKLYAMRSGRGVSFLTEIPEQGCVGVYERAPEYDIEYPEPN